MSYPPPAFRRLVYDFANERDMEFGEWSGRFVLCMTSEDPEWDIACPRRGRVPEGIALLCNEIHRRRVRGEALPRRGELPARHIRLTV